MYCRNYFAQRVVVTGFLYQEIRLMPRAVTSVVSWSKMLVECGYELQLEAVLLEKVYAGDAYEKLCR